MSLTKFLNKKDVREKFREEYPTPRFDIKKEILCPPLTQDYGLVGTAFDYLLRFYIKYSNPKAITPPWIAEISVILLKEYVKDNKILFMREEYKKPLEIKNIGIKIQSKNIKPFKFVPRRVSEIPSKLKEKNKIDKKIAYHIAEELISQVKKEYSKFLKKGKIKNDLIKSTLFLAELDHIHRPGIIPISKLIWKYIDNKNIDDLRNLISVVEPEFFKADKICLLNPIFNKASILVKGADADLVIDDMLIDIKTTKKLQMNRDYFNQLIGYYTLYRIGGIDGMPPQNEIKKLGIYFSRYGYLHLYKVEDIINENRFTKFLEWFKERARQEFWKSKKLEEIL